MRAIILNVIGFAAVFTALPASGQEPAKSEQTPIFHVTVVENTISAINYQYRQGPTRIDFRGTVLMPEAKGEATVESKRGRTEIDARFEHLLPTQRFGREYLTYTLWAVTPEGGVRNIAEIVPGPSDKATLQVSTDLQAFGLIVTAEPYSATRHPSNVVVLENRVRPDTEGKIEQVQAKYELMPRSQYTWQEPAQLVSAAANAPKVSMDRYEAILELYEAQNAIGIARAANAEQYAPQTLAKAQQLYDAARSMESGKASSSAIVQDAREAVQTAEDARMIAERRREEETVARAQTEAAQARQAQARAEDEKQRAESEAGAAQIRADAERAAREQAEADTAEARERESQAETRARTVLVQPQITVVQPRPDTRRSELRMGLLEQLNGVVSMRDTARGLVATLADSAFSGWELTAPASGQVARFAAILRAHPGLHIAVEGNTDSSATEALSFQRAEAVRRVLIAQGLPAGSVTARGLGDTHPFGSNSGAAGREANRRVEIVITGDSIGDLPFWDHPYTLTPGPPTGSR
jgi:outer membrane protein OmpA-like peptidoglycan-associated protein